MMFQKFKAGLTGAVLAGAILAVPASSIMAQTVQPPVTAEDAVRNIQDKRHPSQLSEKELRNRIIATQILMSRPGVPRVFFQRLIDRQNLARMEMQKRQNPSIAGQVRPLPKILSDNRAPSTMSVPALRNRIATVQKMLLQKGHSKNTRTRLVQKRRAANAELSRRNERSKTLRTENFSVLADKRPVKSLTLQQLRKRVKAARSQLKRADLPSNIRLRINKRFAVDRKELRARIAKRNTAKRNKGASKETARRHQTGSGNLARSAQSLLDDPRHASRLNRSQLNNRVKAARSVLLYQPMQPRQRQKIKAMIDTDRAEKRRRLIAARDRRRNKLANLRHKREPYKYGGPVSSDVAVAEADSEMLRRRLRAPDLRSNARRYTRNEIIRNPGLTGRFAGIDIDSINFGFNEYWIREEEVDELERIALEIERILAVRPHEVFMIEGHTDAVGSDRYNKELSLQRAKAVKQALTSYFVISPQNLIPVGLGERYLKIPTQFPEAENRRVTMRRITSMLRR